MKRQALENRTAGVAGSPSHDSRLRREVGAVNADPPGWGIYVLAGALTVLYVAACRRGGRIIRRVVSRHMPGQSVELRRVVIIVAALVFGIGMAFIVTLAAVVLWYAVAAIA